MSGSVGIWITTLKAQLSYIFEQLATSVIISEAQIYQIYEEQLKDSLDKMLKLVDMSLQNFMRRHFFQQFNVIIGQNGISYIRTDFQESQLSQTGQIIPSTSPVNEKSKSGLAPEPPKGRNVISPPPGFSRRMKTLQTQFSDHGFEGIFHPDVLKLHFGDLSDLVRDDERKPNVGNNTLFNGLDIFNGRNLNGNGGALLDIKNANEIWSQPSKNKTTI